MKKLNNREISWFCEEMALLIHAGINTCDSLEMMLEESGKGVTWLEKMKNEMYEGKSFAEAVKSADVFPEYVSGLIRAGEETGHLEEALDSLSGYYEDAERNSQSIRNAVLYPTIILILMMIVMLILMVKVLPIFDQVYASLGGSLTGIAGSLLTIGQIMGKIMPICCGIIGILAIFILAYALSDNLRDRISLYWKNLRGTEGWSGKMAEAQIAQALAMGESSGFDTEESLNLAMELMSDLPKQKAACEACLNRVRAGEMLPEAMAAERLLPKDMCRLLTLGRKSGTEDRVMAEIAERLYVEAEYMLEKSISGIEPALVLITSLMVGIILLSVMMPLMNIMSAIG